MNEVSTNVTFVDKVKEKIKNSFADLIPEEQWDEMIQNEPMPEVSEKSNAKEELLVIEMEKIINYNRNNNNRLNDYKYNIQTVI
jgi:hypothetical protein